MKVIDLLNKIANGEEVPRKFEVNGRIWEWNVNSYNCELHSEFAVTGLRYDLSNLNDEIKILDIEYLNNDLGNKLIKPFLEEEKKIPEKLDVVLLGQCDNWLQPTIETDEKIRAELNPYVIDVIRENTLEIQHKFNELIDYLKSKGDE